MSTAPNLRMLFNTYHNGFDNYPAWFEHHKAMHAKHPLECAEFGAEWLRRWEAVGRLLVQRARIEVWSEGDREWSRSAMFDLPTETVGSALRKGSIAIAPLRGRYRIVLLDGTIVKEWGVM